MLYVVLLSGVVIVPPSETAVPFILIVEFAKAVLGILENKLLLPDKLQFCSVLLVIVWVASK